MNTPCLKKENPSHQGAIGQYAAMFYYASVGYNCYIEAMDWGDTDIVIKRDNLIYKVQVKTTTFKKNGGAFTLALRTSGGNRSGSGKIKNISDTDYDILFVLTSDWKIYEFTKTEVGNRKTINLPNKNTISNYRGTVFNMTPFQ